MVLLKKPDATSKPFQVTVNGSSNRDEVMKNFKKTFADKFEMLGGLMPLLEKFNPLRQEELAHIERELGVKLPESYRQFLLEIGGVTFGAMVVVRMIQDSPGGGPNKRGTFQHLFGADCEPHFGLLETIQFFESRLPENVIPIGDDMMGNYMCLVIKGKKSGRIYFLDHDHSKLYLAAESFEDLLNRLEASPEPPPKPVPDLQTLLQSEWRHFDQLPQPDEEPWNSLCNSLDCSADAPLVLQRIKDVIKLVNIVSRGAWPEDWRDWEKILPRWFLSQCTMEESQKVDAWLWWRPPTCLNDEATQRRLEMDRPWPLAEWVYRIAPERRQWFWWQGVVLGEMSLEVHLEISAWPLPTGAFDWLARAAGAFPPI